MEEIYFKICFVCCNINMKALRNFRQIFNDKIGQLYFNFYKSK